MIKKLIMLWGLVFLFALPAMATNGYVQSSGFGAFTTATTCAQTITVTNSGDLLYFALTFGSGVGGTWSISDSRNGSWPSPVVSVTNGYGLAGYHVNVASGSTTVTATVTGGSASAVSCDLIEYTGYTTFDKSATANGASGAASVAISTAVASELVVVDYVDGADVTTSAPLTQRNNQSSYIVDGDDVAASSGSNTFTGSNAASGFFITALAFEASAGSCTTPTLTLMGVGTCITEKWINLFNPAGCAPADTACTEVLEVCDQNQNCLTSLESVTAQKLCDTNSKCLTIAPTTVLSVSLVVNETQPSPQTLTSPLGTISFK